MAYQVEGRCNENQCRCQLRGSRETRKADKVSIASLSSHQLKQIVCVRSLEAIEERSQMLLNKGKGARILDKRKDSGTIVKLVEELRQAVLLYQVSTVGNHTDQAPLTGLVQLSQQQSMDNQITQLAVSPLPMSAPSDLTGGQSNQVFFQYISQAPRGERTHIQV